MKKNFSLPAVLIVVLSMFAISINAHSVGGVCSIGACGALAPKGSDAARQYLIKKHSALVKKMQNKDFKNEAETEQGHATMSAALVAHRKMLGDWVSKKHPNMKPGSVEHQALVEEELNKDLDIIEPLEPAQL